MTGRTTKRKAISLSPATYAKVREYAIEHGVSMSWVIETVIAKKLGLPQPPNPCQGIGIERKRVAAADRSSSAPDEPPIHGGGVKLL